MSARARNVARKRRIARRNTMERHRDRLAWKELLRVFHVGLSDWIQIPDFLVERPVVAKEN